MSPLNIFSRKKGASSRKGDDEVKNLFKRADDATLDMNEFRNKVLSYIWYDQLDKLAALCDDQVIMTPIFFEKIIAEIKPGNQWNNVLFLMARKMLEAYPDPVISVYEHAMNSKRSLVPHPDGGKEVMAPFVKFD